MYKLTGMKMHNMQKCTRTEDQKMLSGIWGLPEVYHVVHKGYKIVKIHKVWL